MADQRQPVRLLLNDFIYYFLASDERPGAWLETRIYSSPVPAQYGDDRPAKAAAPTLLRAAPDAELGADEKRRRSEVAAMTATITTCSELGLVQMLRDAGLAGNRVASDSFIANIYCERAELGITLPIRQGRWG